MSTSGIGGTIFVDEDQHPLYFEGETLLISWDGVHGSDGDTRGASRPGLQK